MYDPLITFPINRSGPDPAVDRDHIKNNRRTACE